jgi:ligand-binding SRPBCC domain-containing protein
MPIYTLKTRQEIPADIEEVWRFISSPENLKVITPENMGFEIISSSLPKEIYPGMIIKYNVRPLLGIKMTWVTEITQVIEKKYFVDIQHLGPYKFWHHQHHLEKIDGGVLMEDIVNYIPPFRILGAFANVIVISRKLKEIFEYRKQKIEEIFGKF